MEEQQGWSGAGFGDMDPRSPHVHEAVRHTNHRRHVGRDGHSAAVDGCGGGPYVDECSCPQEYPGSKRAEHVPVTRSITQAIR